MQTHAYFVIVGQEQNRLRQWSKVGPDPKAEPNQGKTVMQPQFAARYHFLLSGT